MRASSRPQIATGAPSAASALAVASPKPARRRRDRGAAAVDPQVHPTERRRSGGLAAHGGEQRRRDEPLSGESSRTWPGRRPRVRRRRWPARRGHAAVANGRIGTAGTPPTSVCGGTDRATTAPAATTDPAPTVTPGRIVTLAPIQAPSSIVIGTAVQVPGPLLGSAELVGGGQHGDVVPEVDAVADVDRAPVASKRQPSLTKHARADGEVARRVRARRPRRSTPPMPESSADADAGDPQEPEAQRAERVGRQHGC